MDGWSTSGLFSWLTTRMPECGGDNRKQWERRWDRMGMDGVRVRVRSFAPMPLPLGPTSPPVLILFPFPLPLPLHFSALSSLYVRMPDQSYLRLVPVLVYNGTTIWLSTSHSRHLQFSTVCLLTSISTMSSFSMNDDCGRTGLKDIVPPPRLQHTTPMRLSSYLSSVPQLAAPSSHSIRYPPPSPRSSAPFSPYRSSYPTCPNCYRRS